MATITVGKGSLFLHPNLTSTTYLRCANLQSTTSLSLSKPTTLSFPPLKTSLKQPLNPYYLNRHNSRLLTFSSLNRNFPNLPPQTLTTLFSKITQFINTQILKLKTLIINLPPHLLQSLQLIQDTVVCTVVPLFLASAKSVGVPSGPPVPPLTAIASGMAKWLDICSGVLMVRILLSWFPNMPWEMLPFSAIRDLTDPFLSLFRKIVPPIGNIDVSPLLAFGVLGTLGSILGNAKVANF